ncbi:glycosyl hydrolase family 28-related protein [uncultured Ruminococcus sp.]|uniref:glycosyl hydrolase family 28-related protein n=1 Tax=uncultured Ruminococcus sp. TaxID=165186 RepID=UPI0025D5C18C|nr:glycosyl hydrolase family 28-related protein [uncultured Ruminococcus sp.]
MYKKIFRHTIALMTSAAMAFAGIGGVSGIFRAAAYNYDTITGAKGVTGYKTTRYSKVLTVNAVKDFGADNTGRSDATTALQKAFNYARDNAGIGVQVKVVIPKGTYSVNRTLYVYSDTHVSMSGAVLRKDYTQAGPMLRNAQPNRVGGFDDAKNIIIEGGCLDGNGNDSMADFSNAKFGHMTNLLVKNVKFTGDLNAHHLELGGIRNVTVENCDFSDYRGFRLKEAIQFDMMNSENLFGGFAPFDDTTCTNVIIRKNNFHEVMRGIGSHSSTLGSYFTDFLIEDNTFTNITDCTILMQSYKNITVRRNTMNNVGSGIIVRNMSPFENNSGYNLPVDTTADIEKMLDNDLNTIISGNVINAAASETRSTPVGIQLFGKLIEEGSIRFDYQVEGVRVTDNVLNIPGVCIVMDDVNGIQVDNNQLNYTGSEEGSYDLIQVSNSSDTLFEANTAASPSDDIVSLKNGRIYLKNMTLDNSSDGCCGVRSGRNGSVFSWDMSVTTSGAASSPVYAEKNSGNMVISGGSYVSSGEDSPAALSESVIAINAAELKGGSSEAVRVANPGMMYLYGCDVSTDITEAEDGLTAAAVLYGNDPYGADDNVSRLYAEGGTMSSHGDVIFTTNCKSDIILNNAKLSSDSGVLLRCAADPTRWGWGRTGCGGAVCALTLIRENTSGSLICDSLSTLDVYLTDYSEYSGIPEETSLGELYGSRGHITLNIEAGSAWIIDRDCTISSLHTQGEIKDMNGLHAVIKDSEGNILRDGKSPYTVTVLEDYTETPVRHSAGSLYSFEDFRLNRTALDAPVEEDEDDSTTSVKGDVNGSGTLEIGDLIIVASYVKQVKAFQNASAKAKADVNSDGLIDVKDVLLIAAAIKGLRPL